MNKHIITISRVNGVLDNRPKPVNTTWGNFIDACGKPKVRGNLPLNQYLAADKPARDSQKNGPAIVCGSFSKPDTRSKADLDNLFIIPLDFDDGFYAWDGLVKAFSGQECVIHTSYSNSPECQKYRVFVLLDKPITEDIEGTLNRIIDYFESILGRHIDDKSRTPNQIFFTPSCPPDAEQFFRYQHIHGKPVCVSDFQLALPGEEQLASNKKNFPSGGRPGDQYNTQATAQTVLDLLTNAGWRYFRSRGVIVYVTRPGKSSGVSGAVGFDGTNLFFCHSSAPECQPFEGGKCYDPFAVYALLKHGGDFQAAAKALAAQGISPSHDKENPSEGEYGSQEPKVWPELHTDALSGLLGDFVSAACSNSEADPAAVAATFLVRFGIECGAAPHVMVGDSRHTARLNTVIVGESSKARKGTSAGPVKEMFKSMEGCRTSPGPLSSGEGIIYAVRDEQREWKTDKKEGVRGMGYK